MDMENRFEEMDNKYASKGVANAGLTTAIVAAVASLLGNNGNLGNIFGGGNAKDAEIAELKAERYADKVGLELYRNLDGRLREYEGRFEQQVAYNATNTATIGCISNQLNALQAVFNGLTKTVIPATSICPEPMPRYNSFTTPTAPTT
jgi:hypothetical protein